VTGASASSLTTPLCSSGFEARLPDFSFGSVVHMHMHAFTKTITDFPKTNQNKISAGPTWGYDIAKQALFFI
jgi:hypothetical protein